MKTAEFLNAYPRDLTEAQIHNGATIPEVQATQLYSYSLGHVLFDALSGSREGLPERMAQLTEYEEQVNFASIEVALLDNPDGWRYRNEVNFYGLNRHMQELWTPLTYGKWPNDEHKHAKHFSMNGLALESLAYYSLRENYVRKHGTEILYAGDTIRRFMGRLTGVMQEFDGTIAVLEWAKSYPNITVVPAPAQFEHSTSNANVDLLVIDFANDRAAGIQIKTATDQETRERYDPERIVVIDNNDLGNVRMVRTQRGKSEEVPKPWPGIIAASRVGAIQTRENRNRDVSPEFLPYLRRKKMEAKIQLGQLRADYKGVAAAIGQRIMEKL